MNSHLKVSKVKLYVVWISFLLFSGFATAQIQGNGGSPKSQNSFLKSIGIATRSFARPDVTHVVIRDNSTETEGGGISNYHSPPAFTQVTIRTNTAAYGGGIFNESSNPVVVSTAITENISSIAGGGVYNKAAAGVWNQVTINHNTSNAGGGILNFSSAPMLTGVILSGNNVVNDGGGIANLISDPVLTDVILTGNYAAGNGGGVANFGSNAAFTNVTIGGNQAVLDGGGIYNSASGPSISNSIIYGNTSGIHNVENSNPVIGYSLVQGLAGGSDGNIDGDPLFTDADNQDYTLQPFSPALNAGSNDLYTALNGESRDLAGGPRVHDFGSGGIIDLGAYESTCSLTPAGNGVTASLVLTAGKNYFYDGCALLAIIEPSGSQPVTGSISAISGYQTGVISDGKARYAGRHYQLLPQDNAGTPTATITLFYTQADFDNYNQAYGTSNDARLPDGPGDETPGNLRIARYPGNLTLSGPDLEVEESPTFINPTAVVWNQRTRLWKVTFPVSGFSSFFITGQSDAALPLTLLSFEAATEENHVALAWATADEVNTSHFEVQRSGDGNYFKSIGRVNSRGEGKSAYTFDDHSPLPSAVSYYRLKMIDLDDSYTYSAIVSISVTSDNVLLFPNPATETVNIRTGVSGTITRVDVRDLAGRSVYTANTAVTTVPLKGLAAVT